MTTIAWDGKSLAVDRGTTYGELLIPTRKLQTLPDGRRFTFCGTDDAGKAVFAWLVGGCQPEDWPSIQADGDKSCHAVVVDLKQKKVYEVRATPHLSVVRLKFAWGSGSDVAWGAMMAGADARRAVLIAGKYTTHSGHGVDVIRVRR